MNKKILSFLSGVIFLCSCTSQPSAPGASPAYYSDWDRAIRVDVDMQNMFVSTPRKIERPIDMYMAMALALKYNYTRRMVSYEQSIAEAGRSPVNKIPEVLTHAGYINSNNASSMSPDLKVAWNILDISTVYYQSQDDGYKSSVAFEQSRKVIHNILQETRTLYWKTLTAQKLLPMMDDMIEYMTLEVDEMNSQAKQMAKEGKNMPMADLVKKRKYMEAVKNVSALKRDMETSEVRLASLMGFHPSTEYKLVGPEYGNFALPEMKNDLSQLEWLALTNRPELRVHDLFTNVEDLKIVVKGFRGADQNKYKNDPNYYNRLWSKKAREVGLTIIEDVKNPNAADLANLRRQRMTTLVLSQVYVSWARYMSAVEDYQINMEIAATSENIAEDTTIQDGSRAEKSQLESARAVEDEIKAYQSYADVQDALGNLYATVGLDALPYYMLNDKPSKIAVYLRNTMERWREGKFLPDNRPYLLDVPAKRPPVNLSSPNLIPDMTIETGQRIRLTVPQSVLDKMDLEGKIITKAGLIDDSPLPKWLRYDEATRTFDGVAMPSNVGSYTVKLYITDEGGNVGYLTFKIKIVEVYVPSIRVMGLTEGRNATVLKRCIGSKCTDEYVDETVIGEEVETRAKNQF